jgi:hypothetical protein
MKCQFSDLGCRGEAVGLFFLPEGCACYPDQEQYLCEYHEWKATALEGMYEIIYWGA